MWVIDFNTAVEVPLSETRRPEPMQLDEGEFDAWADEDVYVAPVGPPQINMHEVRRSQGRVT